MEDHKPETKTGPNRALEKKLGKRLTDIADIFTQEGFFSLTDYMSDVESLDPFFVETIKIAQELSQEGGSELMISLMRVRRIVKTLLNDTGRELKLTTYELIHGPDFLAQFVDKLGKHMPEDLDQQERDMDVFAAKKGESENEKITTLKEDILGIAKSLKEGHFGTDDNMGRNINIESALTTVASMALHPRKIDKQGELIELLVRVKDEVDFICKQAPPIIKSHADSLLEDKDS